jgi:hypothetical protein
MGSLLEQSRPGILGKEESTVVRASTSTGYRRTTNEHHSTDDHLRWFSNPALDGQGSHWARDGGLLQRMFPSIGRNLSLGGGFRLGAGSVAGRLADRAKNLLGLRKRPRAGVERAAIIPGFREAIAASWIVAPEGRIEARTVGGLGAWP